MKYKTSDVKEEQNRKTLKKNQVELTKFTVENSKANKSVDKTSNQL